MKPQAGARNRDRRLFATATQQLSTVFGTRRHAGQAAALIAEPSRGLSVFLQRPAVPMDNNFAERTLRGAVIGRRLCLAPDSEHGAQQPPDVLGGGNIGAEHIDVHRWLQDSRPARPMVVARRRTWPSGCPGDEPDLLARPDGTDMSQPMVPCTTRDFSAEEGVAVIAGPPAGLTASPCRKRSAEHRDAGTSPTRWLKDMMARVTMLAMHKDGLKSNVLPPPKWGRNPAVPMTFGPDTDAPLSPPPEQVDEVRPISLRTVLGGTPQSQSVERVYRPLRRIRWRFCATLVGAQMRYTVHDRHGQYCALLGFSTAARKLAPRDRFIGWTPTLRWRSHRQRPFPHPARIRHPQPRLAHLSVVCRQLIEDCRALSHHAPVDRNVRGDAALHWRHLQGLTDGPMSASPRDADGDRHKKYVQAEKTPSGCGPCAKTGNGRSTANPNDQVVPIPPFACSLHAPKR